MANLTIPKAVAENPSLKPGAKLVWAALLTDAKNGVRAENPLGAYRQRAAIGEADIIEALRSLQTHGYAIVDESTGGSLEDFVEEQTVRVSIKVTVETLPILPLDEDSVRKRRYEGDKINEDKVKIGTTIYHAVAKAMMTDWSLTLYRKHRDDKTPSRLVRDFDFTSLRELWNWVDAFLASESKDDLLREIEDKQREEKGKTRTSKRMSGLEVAHEEPGDEE